MTLSINNMDADSSVLPRYGQPESRVVIEGQGVVGFDPDGKPDRVWTRYGHDRPNPWLNSPAPNVTYYVGANVRQRELGVCLHHIFHTAHDGSTDSAEAVGIRVYDIKRAGRRWPLQQCKPLGFTGGNYDRGHLIATQFGAGMESINLVSMPSSVNRNYGPDASLKRGFIEIASLNQRYVDKDHHSGGTLTQSGEFALPNYRLFELILGTQVINREEHGCEISTIIKPSTFYGCTDILYTEILINGERVYRYKIDCDID